MCIGVGMSGPGKCGSCASNIANNKFLTCYLCHKDYHSSCLSDWRDISKASDLDLLNRPGVVWYCPDCVPQLQGYVHAPQLEKKVDKIEGDIGRLGDLLRESLAQTRSFAEVTAANINKASQEGERAAEISERIAEQMTRHHEKEEEADRRKNCIIYMLPETSRADEFVSDICPEMHFAYRNVMNVQRLGYKYRNRTAPRPLKVGFVCEVDRNDFIYRFNTWSQRGRMFAKPDLSKAERDIEYKIRQQKRHFEEINSDKNIRYKIKGRKIMAVVNNENRFRQIDEVTGLPLESAALDIGGPATGDTGVTATDS